ncbi:MAG: c-type cytochrome [Pseudomonadota bacterium]|nr:c-type cytochrome [Pseudomonadota bacterium]
MFARLFLSCIALALALLGVPAWAQAAKGPHTGSELRGALGEARADSTQLELALKLGGKTALFCANCHGANGNSVTPDTPNLAGQNPAYLLEQIAQFSSGQRKHEFMQGLMRALSVNEKVGVAVYYERQSVLSQGRVSAAQASQGKAYYEKACASCHGADGLGSELLSRLAGQQKSYMVTTLKRYRDGSAARLDPTMAAFSRQMSNADIDAVADYLSTLR